jgi:hypothetical protein
MTDREQAVALDLAALKAAHAQMTPGPLFVYYAQKARAWTVQVSNGWMFVASDKGTEADCQAVAALVNAFPALVETVERLAAEVRRLTAELDRETTRAITLAGDVAEAHARRDVMTCAWTLTPDQVDNDYWVTDCGQQYMFFEGGPKANGMSFCPYCGKPLVEARPTEEPGDGHD